MKSYNFRKHIIFCQIFLQFIDYVKILHYQDCYTIMYKGSNWQTYAHLTNKGKEC